MKRILLLFAFYLLASFGVQVQVVGEEPYEILWEMDVLEHKINQSSICLSADSLSYFYQSDDANTENFDLFRRDIETNEIIATISLPESLTIHKMIATKDGKYLAYQYKSEKHNFELIYLRDPITLDLVNIISFDRNIIKENFDQYFSNVLLMDFIVSGENNFAVLMIQFKNIDTDVYTETLVYIDLFNEANNKIIFDNFSNNYNRIRDLQISLSEDKIYIANIHPKLGDNFNQYLRILEWDVFDNFNLESYSFDFIEDFNYNSLIEFRFINDNIILLSFNVGIYDHLIYNLSTKKIIQRMPWDTFVSHYYTLTEKNNCILLTKSEAIYPDPLFSNVFLNYKTGKKTTLNMPVSKKDLVYLEPKVYNKDKSIMISEQRVSNNVMNIRGIKFNFDIILSVDEVESNENTIYPNPADDYIEISIDGAHSEGGQHMNIAIYDVFGGPVPNMSTSVPSGHLRQRRTIRVDVSTLPKGVYFAKIGDRVEKFVKK